MTEVFEAVASWQNLLIVVAIFGFAPGFILRLLVRIYPKTDARRHELVAELYALKRVQRLMFVAEQFETVLFEGVPRRLADIRARLRARSRQVAAVGGGVEARPRSRFLVPVAIVSAIVSIAFTGTGLAARSARPGDTLWGLATVLYADHARSVEAADNVRRRLEAANLAMADGALEAADDELGHIKVELASVSDEDNHDELADQRAQLAAQIASSNR